MTGPVYTTTFPKTFSTDCPKEIPLHNSTVKTNSADCRPVGGSATFWWHSAGERHKLMIQEEEDVMEKTAATKDDSRVFEFCLDWRRGGKITVSLGYPALKYRCCFVHR